MIGSVVPGGPGVRGGQGGQRVWRSSRQNAGDKMELKSKWPKVQGGRGLGGARGARGFGDPAGRMQEIKWS